MNSWEIQTTLNSTRTDNTIRMASGEMEDFARKVEETIEGFLGDPSPDLVKLVLSHVACDGKVIAAIPCPGEIVEEHLKAAAFAYRKSRSTNG